jgi:hypothetical protein
VTVKLLVGASLIGIALAMGSHPAALGVVWPPPGPPPAASDSLEIGGVRLTMDAGLWRNFMPGTPSAGCGRSGPRLQGSALLQPASGSIPSGSRAGRVWVVFPGGVWTAPVPEASMHHGVLMAHFRGGPTLDEHVRCDVIVEIVVPGAGSGFVRDRGVEVVFAY